MSPPTTAAPKVFRSFEFSQPLTTQWDTIAENSAREDGGRSNLPPLWRRVRVDQNPSQSRMISNDANNGSRTLRCSTSLRNAQAGPIIRRMAMRYPDGKRIAIFSEINLWTNQMARPNLGWMESSSGVDGAISR